MFFLNKKSCATLSMREAAQELSKEPKIRLIDVRTVGEYRQEHIPGSTNVPLDRLGEIADAVPNKDARVFVYCQSGSRSRMACSRLEKLGYTDVTNIGGISQWPGKTVGR